MNTEIAGADIGTEQERNILVIAYVLHALALVTGLTAIAGVIVNHIKIKETQSPFIRSHHSWMMRTFWWGLLWSVICTALAWVLIGVFGYFILAVWWLYRIVRGILAYTDRKILPA